MHWYDFLAYFFGGAFLANALPHLTNGVSGRSFQSLRQAPGQGPVLTRRKRMLGILQSRRRLLLIVQVGAFSIHNLCHVAAAGAGMLLMSLMCALTFGRFHSGR